VVNRSAGALRLQSGTRPGRILRTQRETLIDLAMTPPSLCLATCARPRRASASHTTRRGILADSMPTHRPYDLFEGPIPSECGRPQSARPSSRPRRTRWLEPQRVDGELFRSEVCKAHPAMNGRSSIASKHFREQSGMTLTTMRSRGQTTFDSLILVSVRWDARGE
jgi:hypothetical protein